MEKTESLSFPTVPGSGGLGQSLHNEILVGATRLNCLCPTIRFFDFHTILYVESTLTRPLITKKCSGAMADATEIAPNEGMHALPPTRRVARVVHAPGKGDGQNWPLASAGKAVAAAATPQPRKCIFRVMTRGRWTSPLNRRGR